MCVAEGGFRDTASRQSALSRSFSGAASQSSLPGSVKRKDLDFDAFHGGIMPVWSLHDHVPLSGPFIDTPRDGRAAQRPLETCEGRTRRRLIRDNLRSTRKVREMYQADLHLATRHPYSCRSCLFASPAGRSK